MKFIAAFLTIWALTSLSACSADSGRTTVRPSDTGAALINPGMGWVLHFYDNSPGAYGSQLAYSDTVDDYPGLSVVYLRIPWSYIEPEEGKFVWSVLDSPAQRWIARGKQVAIRISCSESWMRYATPEWVKNAGAKGYEFTSGDTVVKGQPNWEPDFDDPVFLEKLDNFLAVLGERYDANPEVAFVDVGSFGVWGEGHVFWSTKKPYPASTINRHMDIHRKHFRRTLLVANDDYAMQGEDTIAHADKLGLTLRDDSILVDPGDRAYFHSGYAQRFWQRLPVILESQHYGMSKNAGIWGDGSKYLQAVEDYHASYVSIHWWPREFLNENRDLVNNINMRLGYRLQLVEASWPDSAAAGSRISFTAKWRNTGVAPCLPGGFPTITLKDSQDGIAAVMTDDSFDMRSLPVAAPGKAEPVSQTVDLPVPFNLKPGKYDLYISVGTPTGSPRIALPLSDDDSARRYRLGTITVGAETAEKPLFTFGVLADVQYADVASSGSRHYRASLGKLDECVKQQNASDLAFVVQLGDVIDHGFASFDPVLERYGKLQAPHYHVLGNHDFACQVGQKSEILNKLGMKTNYYDFTHGKWRFIVLDGNDIGFIANSKDPGNYTDPAKATDPEKFTQAQAMLQTLRDKNSPNAQVYNGAIGREQLEWLKSRLQKATEDQEKVVIFCHFPIFPAGTDCNLWNDNELLHTIEPFKCVKAWINGHYHAGNYATKDGIHYLTLPGMVETSDTTAYAKVEVYADRLQVVGTGRVSSRDLTMR